MILVTNTGRRGLYRPSVCPRLPSPVRHDRQNEPHGVVALRHDLTSLQELGNTKLRTQKEVKTRSTVSPSALPCQEAPSTLTIVSFGQPCVTITTALWKGLSVGSKFVSILVVERRSVETAADPYSFDLLVDEDLERDLLLPKLLLARPLVFWGTRGCLLPATTFGC